MNRGQRVSQLQDQSSIEHILTGCAPMHVAHRLFVALANQFRERFHHGNGVIPCFHSRSAESPQIEKLGSALVSDRRGSRFRNHVHPSLGTSQSGLEIQHSLQARTIGENLVDGLRAEQWIEQFHIRGVCSSFNRLGK